MYIALLIPLDRILQDVTCVLENFSMLILTKSPRNLKKRNYLGKMLYKISCMNLVKIIERSIGMLV